MHSTDRSASGRCSGRAAFPLGRLRSGSIMSLAAFNAETASGEGAHGPDRSRLAKCYHCSTNRQKRQSAPGTGSAGVIYRNRSCHWWPPVTSACRPWTVRCPLLRRMDAYWRAANYLSVGQICLYNNLPLRKSLELSHVKPEVSGTGARHRVGARGPGCRDKLIALENWL
jgi:hypothetical protein